MLKYMVYRETGTNCIGEFAFSALNSTDFTSSIENVPTVSLRFVAAAYAALNTEKMIVINTFLNTKKQEQNQVFLFLSRITEKSTFLNIQKGESYGLTSRQVKQFMERQRAKERRFAIGYVVRPKGRPVRKPLQIKCRSIMNW